MGSKKVKKGQNRPYIETFIETTQLIPLYSFFDFLIFKSIRLHEKKKFKSSISHHVSLDTKKNSKLSQNEVFLKFLCFFSLMCLFVYIMIIFITIVIDVVEVAVVFIVVIIVVIIVVVIDVVVAVVVVKVVVTVVVS